MHRPGTSGDADLTLMLAGDVMTGRGIDQALARPSAPQLFESHVGDARDYLRLAERVNGPIEVPMADAHVWGEAIEVMRRVAPDLRIVNLETAITTADDAWPGKGIHYRMHPANIGCLRAAGIHCCVLANNHVLDWGTAGLLETLRVLDGAGVRHTGAGADAQAAWRGVTLTTAAGTAVRIFSVTTHSSGVPADWAAGPRRPGVARLPDLSRHTATALAEDIERRRRPGDVVVLSIHWGGNWGLEVPAMHRAFAHRLFDLGAVDVLHGHSSHHPLPIEVYRGRPILYGCGDLINDYEGITPRGALRSDLGCLYFVTLARGERGGTTLRQLGVVPLQMKRFRLGHADDAARAWLEAVFASGGCRLEAARYDGLARGWSLRWDEWS